MKDSATMHTGPLGSTIHVLRADAGTIAELAAIDWTCRFRRVCLDPVRGIITLMAPSRLHEDLSEIFGHIVMPREAPSPAPRKGSAAPGFGGRANRPARGWSPTVRSTSASAPEATTRPLPKGRRRPTPSSSVPRRTWVVEVEITHADAGKAERYGEMGVRELWRLHGRKGTRELRAEFLALTPGSAPRNLGASEVLGGLTPDDVCEAVEGVRFSQTLAERMEAVARIVHRRQRGSVRVSEEETPYHASL